MKNLFYLTVVALILSLLVACSDDSIIEDEPLIYEERQYISEEFIKLNAKIGITPEEVEDVFGQALVTGEVENKETWLYDSTAYKQLTYDQDLVAFAADEIKQEALDYQLYINFVEDKAVKYSYYYKGDDGNVWQYEVTDSEKPVEKLVME